MARNLDKYKVQAYQSPYTQELFIDEKDFQRHLNTQAKYKKERDAKETLLQDRRIFWNNFRQRCLSKDNMLDQLERVLCSEEFKKLYPHLLKDNSPSKLKKSHEAIKRDLHVMRAHNKEKLEAAVQFNMMDPSVSHVALHKSCRDRGYLEGLDSIIDEIKSEIGIKWGSAELVLPAATWPFVALEGVWASWNQGLPGVNKKLLRDSINDLIERHNFQEIDSKWKTLFDAEMIPTCDDFVIAYIGATLSQEHTLEIPTSMFLEESKTYQPQDPSQ